MPFRFEESMVNEYLSRGFLIMREIVPPTLLRDLRVEAEKARALAHKLNGRQTQRIQPLSRYEDDLDLRPFHDYCDLPELRDAVTSLLGPNYTHGHVDIMGLLTEPADHPWNVGWHRDGVVEVRPEARDEVLAAKLAEAWYDLRHYNQVNCAIYNDSCTWYVPGSHARRRDLPGEMQSIGFPSLPQWEDFATEAEFERACYLHCAAFPGAQQMHLIAGDYMLYRSHGWHCGNYLSYQPRATIHDSCVYEGGEFVTEYRKRWAQVKEQAIARHKERA